jgi:cell pole-organizing protein PopZ
MRDKDDALDLADSANPLSAPDLAFGRLPDPEPSRTGQIERPADPVPGREAGREPELRSPAGRPGEDQLLSRAADAMVNEAGTRSPQPCRDGHTLEDLVREMLRPMLRDWLDENLPAVVERLVRAEIERLAGGGR